MAACIASLPLFVSQVRVAFAAADPEILGAARTDGAGFWAIFFHIQFPLARPGLIAGTTLAFARALGDFGATLMVASDTPGLTQTMPMAIYDAVLTDNTPAVKLFVALTVFVSLAVCILAARLNRE